jgi:hypothetical protein
MISRATFFVSFLTASNLVWLVGLQRATLYAHRFPSG